MNHRILAAACLSTLLMFTAARGAADGRITEGRLEARGPDGKALGPCPLKHTDVDVRISGMIGRVTVTQQFHNPFSDKIEAIYVFPLHQDAAVDAMTMRVGDRLIRGVVKERGEARRIYEQARDQGKVASLLDQERPNIFTQSVANIEPGEKVEIRITYSQTVKWEDGRFQFDFPMVVGPRYIPGGSQAQLPVPAEAKGEAPAGPVRLLGLPERAANPGRPHPVPPTDQVPDADRITPPVTPEGTRAGHDISLSVMIDAGRPIEELRSEQHEITIAYPNRDRTQAAVALKRQATIPNRDFVLGYRTAGEGITDSILSHTDEKGRFFTLVLQPPKRVIPDQIVPREVIFVIDKSGSMRGFPIDTAKEAMRLCIENLGPQDTFNLMTFAGGVGFCFDKPVANTDDNRAKALAYLKNLQGSGGTEMMKAIAACLGGPQDKQRLRIVCFMTDGYVGNDHTIIDEVKKNAADTRVFSFGIGSSVNRYLLDGMAGAGRGEVHYILDAKQAEGAAERFYERISAPVLTDIELDFGDLAVEQVYPRAVPDLFSSKPVVVKGRYRAGGKGVVTLRGRTAKGAFSREIQVDLPDVEPANAVLAQQWARAKVDFLMGQDLRGLQQGNFKKELKDEVIGLGVDYQLLTAFTSFVAVEELRITQGGQARTIRVPVEMPQGVSYEGVFGKKQAGFAGRALFLSKAAASPRGTRKPHPVSNAPDLSDEAGEATRHWGLEQLEKQRDEGKLSPKDIETKLLPLKLDKKLLELLKKGGSELIEVQVQVTDFSEKTLAALKKLGFTELGRTRSVKLLVGTVGLDKVKELALLKQVRRVTPLG